jgi:hypothetical protein
MMMRADLDDTSRCPSGDRCEGCGVTEELTVCTASTGAGVMCLTLCPSCLPPAMAPVTAALLVGAHCEHLGIDLDEMAAGPAAEAQPGKSSRPDTTGPTERGTRS